MKWIYSISLRDSSNEKVKFLIRQAKTEEHQCYKENKISLSPFGKENLPVNLSVDLPKSLFLHYLTKRVLLPVSFFIICWFTQNLCSFIIYQLKETYYILTNLIIESGWSYNYIMLSWLGILVPNFLLMVSDQPTEQYILAGILFFLLI